MKITPLEIRQKTFERTLRGYDKDEVNAFLLSLSQEWERMMDEVKELRSKFDLSEKEVAKLREVETSLFKTLKTAEDTGANVIEQANKAAELHLREAQLSAEAMLNEARTKARNNVEEAEETSRQILAQMEENIQEMVRQCRSLEQQRNNLVDDLRRLANESMDRVERFRQSATPFNAEEHLNQVRRQLKKSTAQEEQELRRLPVTPEAKEEAPMRSFFDEVA